MGETKQGTVASRPTRSEFAAAWLERSSDNPLVVMIRGGIKLKLLVVGLVSIVNDNNRGFVVLAEVVSSEGGVTQYARWFATIACETGEDEEWCYINSLRSFEWARTRLNQARI